MNIPDPPEGLGEEGVAMWRRVLADLVEPSEAELALVQLVAESHEMRQAALAVLRREGPIVESQRGGPKAHPASAVARDAALVMLRALRSLGLPVPLEA